MSKIIDTITTLIGVGIIGYFGYTVLLPKLSNLQLPSSLPSPSVAPPQQQPQGTTMIDELASVITPPPSSSDDDDAPPPTTRATSSGGGGSGPGTLTQPSATGGGVVDSNGIKHLFADGDITIIKQSRTDANDHRWSGNVSGLGKLGMEATMIVDFTSASVASGGHFAMKHGGGNHSGSGASGQKWYDTGIRANGAIQVETEHPHPKNHTYACSDVGGCSVSNIGKGMKGSIIGLKWVLQPMGSGNFIALYYDSTALVGGKPANQWKKVFSIVDTKLLPGWKPPDTQDCEIRISDTSGERAYAGGLHVRKFTKPMSQGSASYARAYYSSTNIAKPNLYNSRYPIVNRYNYGRRM